MAVPPRWSAAWLIALVLFLNHLARDVPGTVEAAVTKEKHRLHATPAQFARMTAAWFAPSVATPLMAGMAAPKLGGTKAVWLAALLVCLVGHATAAVAAGRADFNGVFAGRVVAGGSYEIVDMLFIGFVSPLFGDGTWGTFSGVVNGSARAGSIAIFAAAPALLAWAGLPSVFYAAAVAFLVAAAAGVAAVVATNAAEKEEAAKDANDEAGVGDNREEEGDALLESSREALATPSKTTTVASDLQAFSLSWWLYCLAGFALYSSVVPFWFFGARLLATRGHLSAETATNLMVVPEGAIVFVSLPVGILVDRYRVTFAPRMRIYAAACTALAGSHAFFLLFPQFPIVSVLMLGFSYATGNALLWASFNDACLGMNVSLAAGLLASFLNLGSAAVPGAISVLRSSLAPAAADDAALVVLCVCALAGAVLALATARAASPPPRPAGARRSAVTAADGL